MIVSPGQTSRLRRLVTLAWLPVILVAAFVGVPPVAHPLAAGAAAAVVSFGWVVLVLRVERWAALSPIVGVLATAVGAIGLLAALGHWSAGSAFCYVAVASAGGRLNRRASVAVLVAVAVAMAALLHARTDPASLALAVALLGMALGAGIGRREVALRAEQREQALASATRAQEEHARAAALAERARIARDVHDALAHSLSALAVQLQGARLMVLRDGAPADTVAQVERAQKLATEGLAEARRAVSALRAGPVTLAGGLRALVDEHPDASLELSGTAGGSRAGAGDGAEGQSGGADRDGGEHAELGSADRETVLRIAQEALSNARKHAPEAPVSVRLHRDAAGTELTVRDRPGRRAARCSPGSGGPGGYGLLGMAERAALIGAEWNAGPTEDGWQVRLRIPR